MNELISAIRRNLQEATIFTAGINLEYYTVYVLMKTTIQKNPQLSLMCRRKMQNEQLWEKRMAVVKFTK